MQITENVHSDDLSSLPGRIDQLLAEARRQTADSDVGMREARELLGALSGLDSAMLYAYPELDVGREVAQKFFERLRRLLDGEPLAYLTGFREFFGRRFKVTHHTLVPRPETECLVALALRRFTDSQSLRVLDLGTGSGAIVLTLAAETRPIDPAFGSTTHAFTAVDRCADALAVARENSRLLGMGTDVEWLEGDWFNPVATRQFDIVVSNPPYVESDFPGLVGELRHEPVGALAAGEDGLDEIRRICAAAPGFLAEDGWLAIEHAPYQAGPVQALMREVGLKDVGTVRDLAERERVTHGRRAA